MTFSTMDLIVTLSIKGTECRVLFIVMLSVIMLNGIMLIVVMLNVVATFYIF